MGLRAELACILVLIGCSGTLCSLQLEDEGTPGRGSNSMFVPHRRTARFRTAAGGDNAAKSGDPVAICHDRVVFSRFDQQVPEEQPHLFSLKYASGGS